MWQDLEVNKRDACEYFWNCFIWKKFKIESKISIHTEIQNSNLWTKYKKKKRFFSIQAIWQKI